MNGINPRVLDLYVLTLMAALSAIFFFIDHEVGSQMGSATIGGCAMYLRGELSKNPEPAKEGK